MTALAFCSGGTVIAVDVVVVVVVTTKELAIFPLAFVVPPPPTGKPRFSARYFDFLFLRMPLVI